MLKRLDIAYVDDDTYKRLVNICFQYDYIESELLEQLIEAELILLLDRRSFWKLLKLFFNLFSLYSVTEFLCKNICVFNFHIYNYLFSGTKNI